MIAKTQLLSLLSRLLPYVEQNPDVPKFLIEDAQHALGSQPVHPEKFIGHVVVLSRLLYKVIESDKAVRGKRYKLEAWPDPDAYPKWSNISSRSIRLASEKEKTQAQARHARGEKFEVKD